MQQNYGRFVIHSLFGLLIILLASFQWTQSALAGQLTPLFSIYRNPEENFQIEIPAHWKALSLSPETVTLGIEMTGQNNPQMSAFLNSPTFRQLIANGMKFYALDLSQEGQPYALPANINVLKLAGDPKLSLDTLKQLNERQIQSLAVQEYRLRSEIVTINGINAVLFQYVTDYQIGFSQSQLTQITQILLMQNETQYVVTVGIPLIAAEEYSTAVEHILKSFQLLTMQEIDLAPTTGIVAATPTAPPTVSATVQASSLNIRKGPGTGYSPISHVNRGDTLQVVGQVANCAWLQVTVDGGAQGWVAGASQFVTLHAACATIPLIKGIVIKNDNPGGQGCISFQNNINAELTITFTSKDGKWNETFKVGRKAQQRHCFRAGEYTFTVDAPPPWGSFNDRVIIPPGANIPYPVNPG